MKLLLLAALLTASFCASAQLNYYDIRKAYADEKGWHYAYAYVLEVRGDTLIIPDDVSKQFIRIGDKTYHIDRPRPTLIEVTQLLDTVYWPLPYKQDTLFNYHIKAN